MSLYLLPEEMLFSAQHADSINMLHQMISMKKSIELKKVLTFIYT